MTSTLAIKDLSLTEELDASAMRAVRGGYAPFLPVFGGLKLDSFFNASQLISQAQSVVNMNANNAAFDEGIGSQVSSTQNAKNNIYR